MTGTYTMWDTRSWTPGEGHTRTMTQMERDTHGAGPEYGTNRMGHTGWDTQGGTHRMGHIGWDTQDGTHRMEHK